MGAIKKLFLTFDQGLTSITQGLMLKKYNILNSKKKCQRLTS